MSGFSLVCLNSTQWACSWVMILCLLQQSPFSPRKSIERKAGRPLQGGCRTSSHIPTSNGRASPLECAVRLFGLHSYAWLERSVACVPRKIVTRLQNKRSRTHDHNDPKPECSLILIISYQKDFAPNHWLAGWLAGWLACLLAGWLAGLTG